MVQFVRFTPIAKRARGEFHERCRRRGPAGTSMVLRTHFALLANVAEEIEKKFVMALISKLS